MKYLDYYNKWVETGMISYGQKDKNDGGLCGVFGNKVMEIFSPTYDDCLQYHVNDYGYWGTDWDVDGIDRVLGFTPTRQNIVLLLAAMNDEL